jgi:PAS domain S-box-containing protein
MSAADQSEKVAKLVYWLHPWPRKYGFALGTVAVAALARYGLHIALGFSQTFILFYPTIIVIAWLGGFGPGFFALLSSGAVAEYFFLEPFRNPRDIVRLALFGLVGVAISALGEVFRRSTKKLEEFEAVVEGLQDRIVVVDREYRFVIANRAFLNYQGMRREELVGRRISEVLNPGLFETLLKGKLDECFQGKVVQFEMRDQHASRGERDFFVSYFPIKGPGGVDRVASVSQDITERKKADHSLQLFRTLIDRSNDAVEVVDPETLRFLDVNEKAYTDLGYTREELLSLTVFDIDPEIDEITRMKVRKELQACGFALLESMHRRKDGSTFPVETSLTVVELDRRYVVAVSRDISDRKRAEAGLRESEDRYRDLIEHSEDLVCTHDLEGRLLSVNPAPARILGYGVAELLKVPMRELIAPEGRERFDEYLKRIRTTGADQGLLCVVARNGERRIWEYHNTLRTDGVALPIVRGMARDITEHKHAEAALRRSEGSYRLLFEKNVAGVVISSMDGIVLDCNDAWAGILGYRKADEVRGRSTAEFYCNAADREPLLRDLRQEGAFFSREIRLRRKNGAPVWVLFNTVITAGGPDGASMFQATAIDITERKVAEEALRRREEDYRSFVAQSSEGIFRQELDTPLVIDLPEDEMVLHILHHSYMGECNDALARMYGFTSGQELVAKRLTEMLAPDDPRNIQLTREYIRSGFNVLERESHEIDIHGHPKVFRNSMIGIIENGMLMRTWGIQRDVTEQVKAEEGQRKAEQLRAESEERFRVALKDSPITVFNQDRDLRYTWIYNPQSYWQQDVIGKTDEEIIGPKKSVSLIELKRRVLKTGVTFREEVVIPHNGRNDAFDVAIEPLFDVAGNVIGITGAFMDIGRLREVADRLQDARDKLAQEKTYLEGEIQAELGFEEIIGQSPALFEVLKNVRVVAPTDSTVLLLGETGTGKELVARSVHALSSRRDKTFIKLNCAAVPEGLLESELFGHEKGAFTGAVSQKVGRVELADKGTLFLDEIGELPVELQPKLLRVLQDREFERLGGVRTLHVDVRIISATNRDLHQDIADKKFREDLFYRLNVFPIELPSLRQRRSDIPILVHHFVNKHSVRMGKHIESIPDETMTVLQNWNWPGNIRELENMIERMVILSKGRVLAAPPVELDSPQDTAEDDLTQIERDHIIRVLQETNGVLSGADGAASRLRIKRTTLQSMLKRFGIELQDYRRGSGAYGPS